MLDLYDPERDVVWIDSVSMRRLVNSIRQDAQYKPGTSILQTIGPGTKDGGNWFFLTAGHVSGLPEEVQFELPMMEEIYVPDELVSVINSLSAGTSVAIGISAPKQNRLAAVLYEIRPDLEYHCLGAAVTAHAEKLDSPQSNSRLSGSGIEWLRFLFTSPRRTWAKIETTLKELWLVRTHQPSRTAFVHFSSICAPAQPASKIKPPHNKD